MEYDGGVEKINTADARQVVPKELGHLEQLMTCIDMTIPDQTRQQFLVLLICIHQIFVVLNSDFRVYACLQNGTDPDNTEGRPSLDEPTFTDLEPRSAGTSGDGYIWKYLYTIKPSEVVRFESTDFMPVPTDWLTAAENAAVRDNAVDGGIKIVTVTNKGVGLGTANSVYTSVPIKGDGTGAECTIVVDANQQVSSVTVSSQGSGYTFGNVDLVAGGVPTGTTRPTFDVIIPPQGGHGADIYRELGAYNVLLYSRIENDSTNPDFITGNQIARVGVVENPQQFGSTSLLTADKASALNALKLVGTGYSTATFSETLILHKLFLLELQQSVEL